MEQNEPRILQARFAGVCAKCGKAIMPQENIIHWAEHKATYHAGCGREAYQTFWFQRLYTATQAYNALQLI